MAVKLDIVENERVTTVTTTNTISTVVEARGATSGLDVVSTTPQPVVVEVMKGLPGTQNVYIGDTPPENPEEGWIWIDTS